MKVVYSIIEPTKEGAKAYWQRLGTAFENKDGSLNILLNGLPVNGKLHVREEEPRDGDKARPQKRDNPGPGEQYGTSQDDGYPF